MSVLEFCYADAYNIQMLIKVCQPCLQDDMLFTSKTLRFWCIGIPCKHLQNTVKVKDEKLAISHKCKKHDSPMGVVFWTFLMETWFLCKGSHQAYINNITPETIFKANFNTQIFSTMWNLIHHCYTWVHSSVIRNLDQHYHWSCYFCWEQRS